VGFSLGAGASVPSGKSSRINFGGGISSMDGANLNGGFSIGDKLSAGIGFDANSREGFQNINLSASYKLLNKKYYNPRAGGHIGLGGTASFTFGKEAFTPKMDLEFRGRNYSFDAEVGLGSHVNQGLKGKVQYSGNFLAKKMYKTPAYGFFNLKSRPNNEDIQDKTLLDFNREKDGTIKQTTTNLAAPIATADVYNISGQGIGGAYMAQRSDIGILTDPYVESENRGGGAGLEFNAGFELGVNINGVNWSRSRSKKWEVTGNLSGNEFIESVPNSDYEPYYIKSSAEMTAEPLTNYASIGDDKAMYLRKDKQDYDEANPALINKVGVAQNIVPNNGKRSSRKPRASSVQFITNKDLMRSGNELLNEFKIEYYETINAYDCNSNKKRKALYRDVKNNPKHHAGVVALQPNGMRYNYALPVANLKQEDYTFSYGGVDKNKKKVDVITKTENIKGINVKKIDYKVSSSNYAVEYPTSPDKPSSVETAEDFFDKNTLPKYNHSYLLTSILGTDYIDADNIPGPSDGDYGYWVKFNYVKTAGEINPYKWREPFLGANFVRGQRSVDKDNKATFVYGEREQYYLATAETKTHFAKFWVNSRNDARGADDRFQNGFSGDDFNNGSFSYQLDKIELYSKLDDKFPLQTTHFDYTNELCPNIKNFKGLSSKGTGKLTLNKVWFTYENNNRGSITPYSFKYTATNPQYNNFKYDRWGNYKELGDNNGENLDFPYTYQNDNQKIIGEDPTSVNQVNRDKWASAWNLSQITMPSGATINVDYESDDYAYVQDRIAMKMFKIQGLNVNDNNNTDIDNELKREILFKLDESITTTQQLKAYIADLHNIGKYTDDGNKLTFDVGERPQLYFKILLAMQNPATAQDPNNSPQEYIEGYANVEEIGFKSNKLSGYVKLEGVDIAGLAKPIHPFTAAGWQLLKTDYPDYIKGDFGVGGADRKDGWNAISKFFRNFGEIASFFTSLYTSCYVNSYGRIIDLSKSVIRLNCPNKIKYGGGSRVNKIALVDNWTTEANTYGSVYEYGEKDANGKYISSYGVATNEPNIGYDECVLRYAKTFRDYKKFFGVITHSFDNLVFEYPIDESYMPGASVGYSKVIIKSLASQIAKSPIVPQTFADIGSTFGTTGSMVYEFYTAKDFPILFEETEIDKDVDNVPIPLFVVNYYPEKYSGSQGYAITLNDMHGKIRSTTSYNQSGTKITEAVYKYKEGDKVIQSISGKEAKGTLDNKVDVLLSNKNIVDGSNYKADIEQRELGVDREFFMDMRENEQKSRTANIGANIFFTGIFPSGFSLFPQVDITDKRVRTVVTNKIIRRSGILIQVENYDGTSYLTTSNKVFDPLTGQPVLSTVNNSFNNLVYNAQSPARYDYESMGAAYENWGLRFGTFKVINTVSNIQIIGVPSAYFDKFVEGDEFIVSTSTNIKTKATLIKKETGTDCSFYFEDAITPLTTSPLVGLEFWLWRSGKRNQVDVSSGGVVALTDPTKNRIKNATTSVATKYPGSSEPVAIDYFKIDKVLNSSATTFSEAWNLSGVDNLNSANLFSTGERGIWRPYQSYVFVKERTTDAAGNINLADNGYYNEMPLFDYRNPFFYKKEYGLDQIWQSTNALNRWRISSEIGQYGKNGSEIETRDILGKYSAVLYGYKDNLPVAVAANAQQNEIGFEGFEEFRSLKTPKSGNLDFAIQPSTYNSSESFNIVGGCKVANGEIQFWIDKPSKNFMRKPSNVSLQLTDAQGKTITVKSANVIEIIPADAVAPKIFNNSALTKVRIGVTNLTNSSLLTGRASLIYSNGVDNSGKSLLIDYANAHTGKSSLKITGSVKYNQNAINFQHLRPYSVSAWVRVADANGKAIKAHTYGTDGKIKIYMKSGSGDILMGQCVPVGEIIEGWQKVEGTITPDLTNVLTGNSKTEWVLEFLGGANMSYFDDIRIFPKDAEMQTFVYDPKDYKLRATLDNNNFASFYFYDESGKLVVAKKETNRGIKTIQETRAFVKSNNK
jgi:hypothetical protein